jgi:hypothetical protein
VGWYTLLSSGGCVLKTQLLVLKQFFFWRVQNIFFLGSGLVQNIFGSGQNTNQVFGSKKIFSPGSGLQNTVQITVSGPRWFS